jgi:6-phosphogluconolactonase (cycloisomerase 2 family)
VIPDPTGRFVLVPDLGADSVRIFKISQEAETLSQLTEVAPLRLSPGSGPRHAVFVEPNSTIFFYVINQISNTLVAFIADYSDPDTLNFQEASRTNLLLGTDGNLIKPQPGKDIKSAELYVSVS